VTTCVPIIFWRTMIHVVKSHSDSRIPRTGSYTTDLA